VLSNSTGGAAGQEQRADSCSTVGASIRDRMSDSDLKRATRVGVSGRASRQVPHRRPSIHHLLSCSTLLSASFLFLREYLKQRQPTIPSARKHPNTMPTVTPAFKAWYFSSLRAPPAPARPPARGCMNLAGEEVRAKRWTAGGMLLGNVPIDKCAYNRVDGY
jgi:hypothetical protein